MPRPASEPPRADRWLAERRTLLDDGPVRRVAVGFRHEPRRWVSPSPPMFYRGWLIDTLLEATIGRFLGPPAPPPAWAPTVDVGLYRLDAAVGDLPEVIVPVPRPGLAARLEEQGGEVDVRGALAPGHGLVLVLDDGTALGCDGPAGPPPPLLARRLWGLRA